MDRRQFIKTSAATLLVAGTVKASPAPKSPGGLNDQFLRHFTQVDFEPGQIADFPCDLLPPYIPPDVSYTSIPKIDNPLGTARSVAGDFVIVPKVPFEGENPIDIYNQINASAGELMTVAAFDKGIYLHPDVQSFVDQITTKTKKNIFYINSATSFILRSNTCDQNYCRDITPSPQYNIIHDTLWEHACQHLPGNPHQYILMGLKSDESVYCRYPHTITSHRQDAGLAIINNRHLFLGYIGKYKPELPAPTHAGKVVIKGGK